MESKAAEGEAEKGLEDGMQSKENGLIGLQSELQSRLAHAFDVSQMFVIFQQMIGEIEEQGRQSDALKSEMRGLRAKLSEFEKLPAKLDEMRGKVRELEQQNQVQRQSEGRGSFDTMYQRFLGEEKEKEEKEIEIKKEEEEGITSSVPIAASAASPLMIIDEVEQTVFVIEAAEELMPQLPSELKRQPSVVKEMLDSLIFSNSLRNMNITTTTSKDEGGDDNKTERRLEMAGELRKNLSSEGMETSNITLLSGEAKGDREEKAATSQFDDDSAATKEEEADETTSPPQTEALSEGTSEQKKTRRVSFAPLPSLQINSPSSSSSSMMTEGEKTTFQMQTHTQGGMFYRGQMTPSRHQLPAKASSSSSLLAPASSSSSSYSVLSPTTAAATTQLLSRHSQLAGLELNSSTREGSGVQPALVVGSFAPILSPTRAPTSSSSSRSPFSFSPDMNTRQHQRVSSQLQGELADGLKVNLVPLDDVNFMVVVTEEDVRLLKEVQEVTGEEDSAVERRLFLMEGLKRAGKVVQHVERFKRSLSSAERVAIEAVAARVKELEHVTNGYVDIITDQRIALKTYPEQLELIRALIMKEQKHAKSIEALPSSSASAPIDVEKQLEKHGQLLMRMLQEHEASSEAHISTMEPMFVSLELLQEVLSPTLRSTKSKWVLHNSSPKEIMGNQLRETACSLFDSFVSIESHHKGLAAVRAEVEALGAERITELEKTVDRCRQRVKTLEETVHNLSRTLQQQMGKTPEWKNELETLSYTVNLMSAQQLNAVKQLMEDLSRLQGELDKKAEDHEIHQIITSLEAEFKRKLGDDVIGLRDVIEKMLGAMRLKPSKDEVTSLLAERLDALQKLFPEQVEGFTAVSVKCLSCGQQRVEPLPDNVLPIEMSYSSSNSTSRFEREEYDQIRAVLTRTAGLKPLAPEHKPMVPRAMPFASRSNLNPAQSIKQSQQPGSGGLLFQRARLARNMIDRVKLPSAATDSITPRLLFEGISDTSSYGGGDIADNYESGGISNRGHQLRNTLRVRTAAGSGRRRASGNNRAIQASSSSFAPYDTGDHLSTASSAYRENDSFASSQ